MKPNLALSLFAIYLITGLISCYNPDRPVRLKADTVTTINTKQEPEQDSVHYPAHVYAKGDSACVIVNGQTICIPKKYKIDLANTQPLIYTVKNDTIEKSGWLVLGRLTLISIDQGTDRGYTALYAIDNKNQTLVRDEKFKRNYLSGFGIFIINGSQVFTMHKYLYHEKNDFKSSGSLYTITNDRFVYIKSRVQKDEIGEADTAIINFSQKPLNKKF